MKSLDLVRIAGLAFALFAAPALAQSTSPTKPTPPKAASPTKPSVAAKIAYPATAKNPVTDDYFGTKVVDQFRWLEDDNSADTKAWVEAQNKVTFAYLESIPERSAIKDRLTQLWNYEKFSAPGKENGKYFYSYNTGLQNQSVLFVTDSLTDQGRILIDPNTLRADGTAALAGTSVDDNAKYIAYGIAEAGSDWNTWKVRDISTGQDLPDTINYVKFSGASWLKDGTGFFYSRFDAPKEGDTLKGSNFYQKCFFHKIGTTQDQDVLVYERSDHKTWGMGAGVTEDGQYAIMVLSDGTDPKNRVYYRDLTKAPVTTSFGGADAEILRVEAATKAIVEDVEAFVTSLANKNEGPVGDPAAAKRAADAIAAKRAEAMPKIAELEKQRAKLVAANGNARNGFIELLNDFDASYEFVANDGPVFYFKTDLNAPKGRLIAIDTTSPSRDNWRELIPQAAETLQSVSCVGNMLFASYLKDAQTQIKVFDMKGKFVREVALPGIGSAGGFGGKRTDTETFYSFASYTTPPTIFHYDIKSGKSTVFKAPKVDFDSSKYETVQKFFTSKDGTKVPVFITAKKGITLDGNNPTLLYGYGGFNISLTPGFSPSNAVWLEMGGVYAVANLRGGGEYGEEWHQAGTKLKKQNVFDDFIGAAEFLVKEKYTKPAKLAVMGGSNGGLLVGAVVNQRPDLFAAAIPAVGVMDMLRFHKFTIGHAWSSDYGNSENPEEFKALFAYSPYHNVKKGTKYPAVMVTTADHDDRVVPAHSFKYAAAIQEAQGGDAPVLIRIDVRAGHGAGKPTGKRIEEAADTWAFIAKNLGMNPKF